MSDQGRTPSCCRCCEGWKRDDPQGHDAALPHTKACLDCGQSGRTPSPHERCHERAAESYDHGYLDGLRAAREAVARQTDLADLVHFERPSDFRKGVLTCVVALDNEIKGVTDA